MSRYLHTVLFATTGAGCPRNRQITNDHAPIVLTPESTLEDVIQVVNSNSSRVQKIQSSGATLTVAGLPPVEASYAFEHSMRDVSYEQLSELIGCGCNTAYQYGLKIREAYQNAFGLALISTRDGIHLSTVDEAKIQNDRVLANFEKHILPSLQKFGTQLRSLQQSNQQYALTARTQALLNAALTEDAED